MSISSPPNSITNGTGSFAGSSGTTGTLTVPSNALILCGLGMVGFSAITGDATISQTGTTWSKIIRYTSAGDNTQAVQWLGALSGSGVSATATITPPASMANCLYCFLYLTGTIVSTVAAAINQSVGNDARDSGTSANLPPINFGAFSDGTNDMTLVVMHAGAGTTFTDSENGGTRFYFTGGGTTENFGVEYALPPASTMGYNSSGSAFEFITAGGIEVKVASGAAAVQPKLMLLGVGS